MRVSALAIVVPLIDVLTAVPEAGVRHRVFGSFELRSVSDVRPGCTCVVLIVAAGL